MKYSISIFILFLLLVSCQQNSLNKEERMAYLKAHVHNSQQMIVYNLSYFEVYKIIYKGDPDYFKNFYRPIHKTLDLYKINEEIYKLKIENKEIPDNHWNKLRDEQAKTKLAVDSII